MPIDAVTAGTDEQIIDAIVQNQAWMAVVSGYLDHLDIEAFLIAAHLPYPVEANATTNLAQARQNGDLSYDPRDAITVYYAQVSQVL